MNRPRSRGACHFAVMSRGHAPSGEPLVMPFLSAFLLAALTSCPNAVTLANADAQFTAADSAAAKGNVAGAKAAYDAGLEQLSTTPWFIGEKSCDPPRYTYTRYVVSLHSLLAAVETGALKRQDAYAKANDMYRQLIDALPKAAPFFGTEFPDLRTRDAAYHNQLESAANVDKIQRHTPSGPGCAYPNVEAEALQTAVPEFPDASRNGGRKITIEVALNADGSIASERVVSSSGDTALDQSALLGARQSTYLPKVQNCVRVPGVYEYSITFD